MLLWSRHDGTIGIYWDQCILLRKAVLGRQERSLEAPLLMLRLLLLPAALQRETLVTAVYCRPCSGLRL